MSGVLIVEAMAQTGGILILSTVPDPENYLTYFMKIDNVKFKQIVVPGDQLSINIKLLVKKKVFWRMEGMVYVGDKLACSAEILSAVKEIKK